MNFIFSTISLALICSWNIFAMIGFVYTIKWLVNRRRKRLSTQAIETKGSGNDVTKDDDIPKDDEFTKKDSHPKGSIEHKVPDTKEKRVKRSKQTFIERFLKKEWDNSSVLLYSGAFLVGFAIFLFVAFNWDSFTDQIKTILIIGITVILYLLAFLFSRNRKYQKVSDTFILLASAAFILTGVGFWNFSVKQTLTLTFTDYWAIFSILLTAVFSLTYITVQKKLYLWVMILSAFSTLIYGSGAFVSEPLHRFSFVIFLTPLFWLIIRSIFRSKRERLLNFNLFRFFYLFADALNIIFVFSILYRIVELDTKLILTISLFFPYIFTLLGMILEKRSFGLMHDGAWFPFKLIVLSMLISANADIYEFLVISLCLLVITWMISMTRRYQSSVRLRRFVAPMIFMSLFLSIALPWNKPIGIEYWDTLPAILSLGLISILFRIKTSNYNGSWTRIFNIPLDLAVTVMITFKISQELGTNYGSEIYGLTILIPFALYFSEWIIRWNAKRGSFWGYIGATIFMLLSVILSSGESGIFFLSSLILVSFVLLSLLISQKSRLTYVLFVSIIFSSLTFSFWNRASYLEGLILMTFIILILGNLWRVGEFLKYKGFKKDVLNKLQCSAVGTSLSYLLLSLDPIFQHDWSVVILMILLISIYFSVDRTMRWYRYLVGVWFVYFFWHILGHSDTPAYANAHLYAMPVVIYLGVLSYLTQDKNYLSKGFFLIANIIPLSVCLIQSIFDPPEFRVYHGILLLILGGLQLIYGSYKKDKLLVIIASVYVLVELIIRLWDVLISIPWWMYVGLVGVILITLSIYIINKITTDKEGEESR